MKKYGSMTLFILVMFLIQVNLFPSVNLIKTTPNLLIIITVGYGLANGHKDGMIAGLISGLLMDSIMGDSLGYYTLPYLYIGFLCGYFRKRLNNDNYLIPGFFCGLADFAMGIYIFMFSFAVRNRLDIGFYLIRIIIPEVIYTVIMSVLVFRLQSLFNKYVEIWVKKRGHKVVR